MKISYLCIVILSLFLPIVISGQVNHIDSTDSYFEDFNIFTLSGIKAIDFPKKKQDYVKITYSQGEAIKFEFIPWKSKYQKTQIDKIRDRVYSTNLLNPNEPGAFFLDTLLLLNKDTFIYVRNLYDKRPDVYGSNCMLQEIHLWTKTKEDTIELKYFTQSEQSYIDHIMMDYNEILSNSRLMTHFIFHNDLDTINVKWYDDFENGEPTRSYQFKYLKANYSLFWSRFRPSYRVRNKKK